MGKPQYRVVMDVSVEGEDRWDGILRNIENLKKAMAPGELELEVVLYGKAFPLATRPEKGGAVAFHPRVEEAVRSGDLVKKQAEGWAYLKPGP